MAKDQKNISFPPHKYEKITEFYERYKDALLKDDYNIDSVTALVHEAVLQYIKMKEREFEQMKVSAKERSRK